MSSELADFHPGTSHKHECARTRVSSGADCTGDCIHDLYAAAADLNRVVTRLRHEQDSIDRNARAYGWQVGHDGSEPPRALEMSPENPFLLPDWRERAGLA